MTVADAFLRNGWSQHPKVRDAGADGMHLWPVALDQCASAETDGVIDPRLVPMWAMLAYADAERAVAGLIAARIWHTSDEVAACPACVADIEALGVSLPAGHYYWHGFRAANLPAQGKDDPVVQFRAARDRALRKDKQLRAKVRARDGDRCRYCGILTVWVGDRVSAVSGTYDHVDPRMGLEEHAAGKGGRLGNVADNVVCACRACNGNKRDRTPAEWIEERGPWSEDNPTGGRLLLPRPGKTRPIANRSTLGASSGLAPRGKFPENGRGQHGAGSDQHGDTAELALSTVGASPLGSFDPDDEVQP